MADFTSFASVEPDFNIPDVEEYIPLPANATEAMPYLTQVEELQIRAATIKLISDMTGEPIAPTESNKLQAEQVAKFIAGNTVATVKLKNYPSETVAYLAGLVNEMNHQIVDDLATIKQYVLNKLIFEAENAATAKDRISALDKIGNIDGVDAFKRRTEVTLKVQSLDEVEKELSKILENIPYEEIKDEEEDNSDVESFEDPASQIEKTDIIDTKPDADPNAI
jgi:hypothetical protein